MECIALKDQSINFVKKVKNSDIHNTSLTIYDLNVFFIHNSFSINELKKFDATEKIAIEGHQLAEHTDLFLQLKMLFWCL